MRSILLWLVLFLICLGLGYPTLNRYDPRATGLTDVRAYYALVEGKPEQIKDHRRHRVLVPLLARPFYRLAMGRLGTWDPVLVGLLAANALLTATTTLLLIRLGDPRTSLLGGMLYLLNFDTANMKLAGLVDSGEGGFLLAVVASLLAGRWWLLPLWGVLGALAKESFVVFAFGLASTWWLASSRGRSQALAILAMAAAGLAALMILRAAPAGHLVWPWQFAASLSRRGNYVAGLKGSILDRHWLFVFLWLLPLGLPSLRSFPRPWVLASLATAVSAFLLGAYQEAAPSAVPRALFNIAGPLLSLSAAASLVELKSSLHRRGVE